MNKIAVSEIKNQVIGVLNNMGLEPIHEYEYLGTDVLADHAELTYSVGDCRVMLYITEQEIEVHNGNQDIKVFIGRTKYQRVKEYFEVLSKVSK